MNKRIALKEEAYPLPPLDPAILAHTYEERLAYLRAEIQKGEDDIKNGRVVEFNDDFKNKFLEKMHKKYGK